MMRLHLLCNEIYNALKFRCPMGSRIGLRGFGRDIVIEGDKNRIFQVVSNLIGNAFKFTTNGSVSYGYRRKGNEIEFHVSDTGIGIEADKLSKVFERFVKVNNLRKAWTDCPSANHYRTVKRHHIRQLEMGKRDDFPLPRSVGE